MDNETVTIARELAANWIIRMIYVAEFGVFVFVIVACSYLVKLLYTVKHIHVNLRLLLGNLATAYVAMAVSRIVDIMRIVIRFLDPNNQFGLLQDQYFCQAIKIPYNCVLTVAAFTLMMLAIERSVATRKAHVYESIKSAKLGIGLVLNLWLIAIGGPLFLSVQEAQKGRWEPKLVLSCTHNYTIPSTMLTSNIIMILIDLAALSVFIWLHSMNKKKYSTTMLNRSRHNLSERYQISENIKTTQRLQPLISLYCLCTFICLSITMYILLNIDGNQATAGEMQKLWIPNQIFSLNIAIYAAAYPWLCVHGNSLLKEKLKKSFCCGRCSATVEPTAVDLRDINGQQLIPAQTQEQRMHFIALQAAWDAV